MSGINTGVSEDGVVSYLAMILVLLHGWFVPGCPVSAVLASESKSARLERGASRRQQEFGGDGQGGWNGTVQGCPPWRLVEQTRRGGLDGGAVDGADSEHDVFGGEEDD